MDRQIGVPDQALNGQIAPDGTATRLGHGFTSSADDAVGRPSPATRYRFHLQSRFTGVTGIRVETRACDAVFSR